jgi:oxalate decarboxylase/phosphoglucose isomerase-like protein (cupin superfamily)
MCLISEKWVCKQVLNDHNFISGAYVSLESGIFRYIKYHVNPETDKIKIKISGTGQKLVSKINNKSLIFCLSSSGKS